ncbi:hypothetical protein BC830DRAFT_262257 [Chytriomyces sp. MP71]|nr:hypothetical protein BC830DRAFT_262257 [Chytriomyces sp. MP71]
MWTASSFCFTLLCIPEVCLRVKTVQYGKLSGHPFDPFHRSILETETTLETQLMNSTETVSPTPATSVATVLAVEPSSKAAKAVEGGASDTHTQEATAAKRKRTVIIGSAAAVLVIVAIIVAVVVVKKNNSATSDSSTSAAAPSTSAGASTPVAPTSANGTSLFAANALTWGGNNERNKVYPNSGLDPASVASSAFGRRATVKLSLSDPATANGTDSVRRRLGGGRLKSLILSAYLDENTSHITNQ